MPSNVDFARPVVGSVVAAGRVVAAGPVVTMGLVVTTTAAGARGFADTGAAVTVEPAVFWGCAVFWGSAVRTGSVVVLGAVASACPVVTAGLGGCELAGVRSELSLTSERRCLRLRVESLSMIGDLVTYSKTAR